MKHDPKKLLKAQKNLRNKPYCHKDHALPVTRRQLLGQGFCSMAGGLLAPSFLSSLFARSAMANECPSAPMVLEHTPYLHFELSGGASLSGNFIFGKQKDGAPLELLNSYDSLGLPAEFSPNMGVDTTFLGPMAPTSAFLAGMVSVMSENAKAKTVVTAGAGTSNDDTANNPLNGSNLAINSVGGNGNLVQLAGTRNSLTGGRTRELDIGLDPTLSKATINQSKDVLNLVDPGLLASQLSSDAAAKILKAASRLTASQLARFEQQDLPSQIKSLVECGYLNSVDLLTRYDASALDPALDPLVTASSFDLTDRDDQKVAAIAKMLADGNAAAGTIEKGGYDYHGRGRQVQDARDFSAGRDVGLCLDLCERKKRPLFIAVTSDGAVSFRRRDARSDSGVRGAYLMIALGVEERPNVLKTQIGAYNDQGAVDTGYLVTASNPKIQALNIVYNYAAFCQKMDGFLAMLAKEGVKNPFQNQDEKYLVFA